MADVSLSVVTCSDCGTEISARTTSGKCRLCYKRSYYRTYYDDPEKKAQKNAQWRRWRMSKGSAYHYERQLAYKYGLSIEDVHRMLDEQEGRCPICHEQFADDRRPVVDHDHDTENVRGLLCDLCNKGLGQMKDNPEALRRAAAWIETHRD